MSPPPKLALALAGAMLLIGITGCQASNPQPQGSTVTTQSAQMPPLPDDENAAKAVVRKMLMNEAIVLLKTSGLKYTLAQFDVPPSFDDDNTQNGDLSMSFQPCSDQQVQAMTAAIWAHGWKKSGVSHGLRVSKGPLFLDWGKGFDGCRFEITTVNISQHMLITDDITRVPELAAFKARP
jgi:hypothetical protein